MTFLSEIFRVPARGIHIISGEKDRRKRIAIAGLSVGEVQERLGH